MSVFVDTSAFYASFTPDDAHHVAAAEVLRQLIKNKTELTTTNYIVLECASLIQRRKGYSYAERFVTEAHEDLQIIWVDEALHQRALSLWKRAARRELSLVDCSSFTAMRHAGIHKVLAFDAHFSEHGFEVVP